MITFNFDVLARPGATISTRQPDPDGRNLWRMFHSLTVGNMCIVCDDDIDRTLFEHWLMREGFKASTYDFFDTKDPIIKAEKVHLLSTMFGRAGWYVDVDPRTIALTIAKGIPSLLVGSPFTIRPEWEEAKAIRPWDELVAEMDRQKILKVKKSWSNMEDAE